MSEFDESGYLAAVMAVVVTILVGINTFLNPNQKMELHRQAHVKYRSLHTEAASFLHLRFPMALDELAQGETGLKELRSELESLLKHKDELDSVSPHVPRWARDLHTSPIRAFFASRRQESQQKEGKAEETTGSKY